MKGHVGKEAMDEDLGMGLLSLRNCREWSTVSQQGRQVKSSFVKHFSSI